MQEILEKLVAANIQLLPLVEIERHFVFERDGFAALVERTADGGFGHIGSPGLLTSAGLAVLLQRGESHVFVARGFEQAATPQQVETLRRFASDLKSALA
jgi:hypothetical protein